MKINVPLTLLLFCTFTVRPGMSQNSDVKEVIHENYEYVEELYKYLHANPELSLQEVKTSERLAEELSKLGFTVTEGVGGHGIAALLENGDGPVVLFRSDLDALPMREETDVSFASTKKAVTADGQETYVMHACGHDMHMATMVGTARVLTELKDQWSGTLIFVGQPAEEILVGARAMIADGLFERFPEPDYMLALHVNSALESGHVGFSSGYAYANVDMGEIIVKGRGGHGAYPELTVDPVVMAAKLVIDLHSTINRETPATEPVNISIGSIQGGSAANIIPDKVTMKIAINTHNPAVRENLIRRMKEKMQATGIAAGLPESEWPELILNENSRVASVYNDPDLSEKVRQTFVEILGKENVHETLPFMYGEDFGEFNNEKPHIPAVLFGLGAIASEIITDPEVDIGNIPSTHSPMFLPDIEPTLRTGIFTASHAIMDLLSQE